MTPSQKTTVKAWSLEIAAAITVLGAAGYMVISPKEQIQQLSNRFESVVRTQHTTDSLQSAQILQVKATVDEGMRTFGQDLNDLVIAECLKTNDRQLYARLNCKTRLGR